MNNDQPERWKLAIPFGSTEPFGILKAVAEGVVDGDERVIKIDLIGEEHETA